MTCHSRAYSEPLYGVFGMKAGKYHHPARNGHVAKYFGHAGPARRPARRRPHVHVCVLLVSSIVLTFVTKIFNFELPKNKVVRTRKC